MSSIGKSFIIILIIVIILGIIIGVILGLRSQRLPAYLEDTREQERLEQEHEAIFQEPEIKF